MPPALAGDVRPATQPRPDSARAYGIAALQMPLSACVSRGDYRRSTIDFAETGAGYPDGG